MKALIFVFLFLLGCKNPVSETEYIKFRDVYREGNISFFANDTSLSMGNWNGANGEQFYMKLSDEPIVYKPEVGKRLKIVITFEVTEAIYDSTRPVLY